VDPSRGFTLLELLVVLVLIVISLSVVAVRFSGTVSSSEIKAAARGLAAGLRSVRSRAITQQKEARLTLDLDELTYRLDGQLKDFRLPKGVEVKLVTTRSEQTGERAGGIRFYPDGTSTGGRITLIAGTTEYAVDVDWLTGRVVILD
jgi:general secretion pathway protein H